MSSVVMQMILLPGDKILLNCRAVMNMNIEVVVSAWAGMIEIRTRGVQIDVGLGVEGSRSEMSYGACGCVIMAVDFVDDMVFVYVLHLRMVISCVIYHHIRPDT